MTTSTPSTPAQPSPGRYWLDVALDTQDPHSMTGAAVTGLLAILVDHEEADSRAAAESAAVEEVRLLAQHLEQQVDALRQVIDDIVAAVKPSTSKLADKVRSIVTEAMPPTPAPSTEPATDPVVELPQPAADDSLEKWREYARSRGFQDVDEANRSMIRTMLGLPVAGPIS